MFPRQSQLQDTLCPEGELFTEYPNGERGRLVNIHCPTSVNVPPNWLAMFLACNHELRLRIAITDKEFTGILPRPALVTFEPSFEAVSHELTSNGPPS